MFYTCKYAPIELFAGFGEPCQALEYTTDSDSSCSSVIHDNLCEYGKALLQSVLDGTVDQLVIVNCCDTTRRIYEAIASLHRCSFVYLLDLPHCDGTCAIEALAISLQHLKNAYAKTTGRSFDVARCRNALAAKEQAASVPNASVPNASRNARIMQSLETSVPSASIPGTSTPDPRSYDTPYIGIMGARVSPPLRQMIAETMPLPVRNFTCTGSRMLRWNDDLESFSNITANKSLSDVNAFDKDTPNVSEHNKVSSTISMRDQADTPDEHDFFIHYAAALLKQIPCARMADSSQRMHLLDDPAMKGIVYHTLRFCDFYGSEYATIAARTSLPLLRLESDYTRQGEEQLRTRIEAFAEECSNLVPYKGDGQNEASSSQRGYNLRDEIGAKVQGNKTTIPPLTTKSHSTRGAETKGDTARNPSSTIRMPDENSIGTRNNATTRHTVMAKASEVSTHTTYVAGIDSGSTSTDVVILDGQRTIVASTITSTGSGASRSAEKGLQTALDRCRLSRSDIKRIVATGYGRHSIELCDQDITEITCHARGAHFLDPSVRTIVDIGGQDSKVIFLDDHGDVAHFVMNDKCAAGTGRFLEMMARTLGLSLDDMAAIPYSQHQATPLSSTCSVFAESEVVSLIARDTDPKAIVCGVDQSVAHRSAMMTHRYSAEPSIMMTGGVARNKGVVAALAHELEQPVKTDPRAQSCGAIGAALYALDEIEK